MKKFFKKTEGFTLVELIVVIAILGILAGVGTVGYSGYVNKAKQAADKQLLAAVNTAFTAACMENGEYDMKFTSIPTATLSAAGVTVNPYNDAFQRYYQGGGAFKYYSGLKFNETKGVFEGVTANGLAQALKTFWDGSSFGQGEDSGKGVAQMLLGTMDAIDGYLAGDAPFSQLFEGAPSSLVAALGFTDMSDGFENMGVMHFANDAKNHTAQEVLTGANNLMTLLSYAYDESLTTQIEEDDLINCYFGTLPDGEDTVLGDTIWKDMSEEQRVQAAKDNLGWTYGDLSLTPEQVVVVTGMAEGTGLSNSADVSGLGGMYALAAGFYNSEYGKNAASKPSGEDAAEKYGQFGTVQNAMNDPNWAAYLEKQALKDMEAYVSFMGCLSEGEFGEGTTFSLDGYQFIADILGFN